jgi:hypothetical protein
MEYTIWCLEEAIRCFVIDDDDDDACPDGEYALSEVSDEERGTVIGERLLERLDEQFRVGNIAEKLSTSGV